MNHHPTKTLFSNKALLEKYGVTNVAKPCKSYKGSGELYSVCRNSSLHFCKEDRYFVFPENGYPVKTGSECSLLFKAVHNFKLIQAVTHFYDCLETLWSDRLNHSKK
jgi:hypothetical protein